MPTSRLGEAKRMIHLDGVFDGIAARKLETALAQAQPGTSLQVDVTKVREFHDLALAVLATAVRRCSARVALSGLRQHQLRMLRYFGLDPSTLEGGAAAGGPR